MATINPLTSGPAISSPGIGSGLDINGIVSKLVALETQPLSRLKQDASTIQSKVSAVGQIKSQLSSLTDALSTLSGASNWTNQTVGTSDTSLAATVDGTATPGTYAVQVQQLAKSQSTISSVLSAPMASGTLTIDTGTVSQGQFAANGSSIQINLTQDDNTLAKVASKINASAAGITATVIKDSSGQRLLMKSSETGADHAFRIQGSTGLEVLSVDPSTPQSQASSSGMALAQVAADAKATINGVQVTSASNTYVGGLQGLSLQFKQVNSSPVEVTISQDSTSMKSAVSKFVSAYNTLTSTFAGLVKYDATTKVGGAFQGDSTITSVQFALRKLVGAAGPDGTQRLTDMGVKFQSDGTLAIDDAKLNTALSSNWSNSKNFFTDASGGFAVKMKSFADGLLSTTGALTNKTESLQKLLTKNAGDQSAVNDRASRVQANLLRQYNALDSQLGRLNSLSNYVTQQVNIWNNSSG